jgi:hypothetical protein
MTKRIHILGGGTFSHVRSHLALAAPAFGETAKQLMCEFSRRSFDPEYTITRHLTKMADSDSTLITNQDVERLVDTLIEDQETKVIVFNVAMCDFDGKIGDVESGKYATRLQTRDSSKKVIELTPSEKIIAKIRKHRKDIFLVAFKTTAGATETEQYIAGLNLLKENSANLVLANDLITRRNMIIVPEEAKYCITTNRQSVLNELVKMTLARCKLKYTRSTVIPSDSVQWTSPEIPESLRTVVDYCIERGAYKPFRGNTAGHFAVKVDNDTFLTSKRSSNFNDLSKIGLVKVVSKNADEVIAYGAKPSVGGQSQRIIFNEHNDVDCIVHFHCPLKKDGIPIRPQWMYECGSHECGQNTSDGLLEIDTGIKAVYLDEHGPNIVFNRDIDPNRVISFIDTYFDLSAKTGGEVHV